MTLNGVFAMYQMPAEIVRIMVMENQSDAWKNC